MNGPGSLFAVFRVESLEWSRHAEGATLRVRGRWRRRRPAGAGPPQLVVARGRVRQRFPATPEPPGLGGAEPGTWEIGFSVPPHWVPRPGDRAWLQIGAVMIPLPVDDSPAPAEVPESAAVPEAGEAPEAEEIPEAAEAEATEIPEAAEISEAMEISETARAPEVAEVPAPAPAARLHAAELALEAAHARAAAAERRHAELEAERDRLIGELEAARRELDERDRAQRVAEQRAHAERAERIELQRELAALAWGRAPADEAAAAMADRIGELETERDLLERRLHEAQELCAAAQEGRRRAEADLARRLAAGGVTGSAAVLGAEAELARARPAISLAESYDGAALPAGAPALGRERQMVDARAAGRGRALSASGRLREVFDAIGAELAVLRAALAAEREARAAAEARADALRLELEGSRRRAADAHAALGALRAELSTAVVGHTAPEHAREVALPPPDGPSAPGPGAAPAFDPGRLDAARRRLRTSATEPEPPAGSAWIARALRALCAEDPAAAGRLVLGLLPVHALREDPAVRYDLVLRDAGIVRVDVPGEGRPVAVAVAEAPRPASAVDFAFRGDLAALGRFVAAGGSSRLRRDRGRITGERSAAESLAALAGAHLRWRALLAAGAGLDGWLALTLAARAIDPLQTRGEHFAIGFSDPTPGGAGLLLQIADGRRPAVAQAPFTAAAGITEIRVAAAELAPLLAGVPGVPVEVRGEARTLERIQGWIELAQSG